MYRAAYRNLGDHEALVVNHTVNAGIGTGVRWYKIRNLSAVTPTFFQGSGPTHLTPPTAGWGALQWTKAAIWRWVTQPRRIRCSQPFASQAGSPTMR